jgi:uncharacterized protein (DUF952 family)
MSATVYKILSADLWRQAEEAGLFSGAGIDLADGFIHLSTALQARKTAALYFKGEEGLVLLAIDAAKLGPALTYEASRDSDLFPHLYGPLALDAVIAVHPMDLDEEGRHRFPEEIA